MPVEDNAAVPLCCEARVPGLQLTNEDLADDLAELLDQADLDFEALARFFAKTPLKASTAVAVTRRTQELVRLNPSRKSLSAELEALLVDYNAGVHDAIKDAVEERLPEAYDEEACKAVCAAVYKHVEDAYWGDGKSKYDVD